MDNDEFTAVIEHDFATIQLRRDSGSEDPTRHGVGGNRPFQFELGCYLHIDGHGVAIDLGDAWVEVDVKKAELVLELHECTLPSDKQNYRGTGQSGPGKTSIRIDQQQKSAWRMAAELKLLFSGKPDGGVEGGAGIEESRATAWSDKAEKHLVSHGGRTAPGYFPVFKLASTVGLPLNGTIIHDGDDAHGRLGTVTATARGWRIQPVLRLRLGIVRIAPKHDTTRWDELKLNLERTMHRKRHALTQCRVIETLLARKGVRQRPLPVFEDEDDL